MLATTPCHQVGPLPSTPPNLLEMYRLADVEATDEPPLLERDADYLLNHCTRSLARDYGEISDAWRFPIIDAHPEICYNEVTFVWKDASPTPASVWAVGTFAPLNVAYPLRQVRSTRYQTLTLRIPAGQVHHYQFIVDGQSGPDPINPQRARLDSGRDWSRFFTEWCQQRVVLEAWEYALLERLGEALLPLPSSCGAVNFLDKMLAREESHRLLDYRLCLPQLARLLGPQPSRGDCQALLRALGRNAVRGWDYRAYARPSEFVSVLRRHLITGAFTHPRHGGNTHASAWEYLNQRYAQNGEPGFDWGRALAPPLGRCPEWLG